MCFLHKKDFFKSFKRLLSFRLERKSSYFLFFKYFINPIFLILLVFYLNTILLPTKNEEHGLPIVLSELKKAGFYRIVVVDGKSQDKTVDIAKKNGCIVITQDGVSGKGSGFQTFLRNYKLSRNENVLMMDADATYSPSDASLLLKALKEVDVVNGNRRVKICNLKSFIHFVGAKIISLIGSLLFLKWNPDICTGYWGFRASALKKMRITAEKFDLEANLFTEVCKKNLSFKSVPVSYRKRLGESKLSVLDGFHIVFKLFKERFS